MAKIRGTGLAFSQDSGIPVKAYVLPAFRQKPDVPYLKNADLWLMKKEIPGLLR